MRFWLALPALLLIGCERTPPVASGVDASRADVRPIDTGVLRDAGRSDDAATSPDAGANDDAATLPDAGANDDAAAPTDAGGNDDASAALDATTTDAQGADATTADAMTADAGPMIGTCVAPAAGLTGAQRYAAILGCLRSAASPGDKTPAIDQFITAVEAGEGFPIQDGSDLVLIYVRAARWDAEDDRESAEDFDLARRNLPITVSGDFNMWANPGPAFTDEGNEFFHVRIPAPTSTSRSGYKLVARDGSGQPVYFSDPLSRRFDFDSFGRISFLVGGADHGHLEWFRSAHATQLNNDRPIYVWLPPAYEGSMARYPVMYMHDGNNLFDLAQPNSAPAGSWEVDQAIEAELAAGRIRAPIVVGIPNNADRFEEYTQVLDDIQGNGSMVGGDALAYADFIVSDLKPRIDARFRTEPARESTAVLGSSLGGLVSYVIGLHHPTVFRYVGGMSSTFAWGQFGANNPTIVDDYRNAMMLPGRDQVFYLDSGGTAGNGCMGVFGGGDNFCSTAAMRDTLVTAGVSTFPDDPNATTLTPANITIYHWNEAGAQHTESAWRARMFRPLRLFFRP